MLLTGEGHSRRFSDCERFEYVRAFGNHSLSFATLQPGMKYFDVRGAGYVGYMERWNHVFVLGDPVCSAGSIEAVLERFQRAFPNACYAQISRKVVDILHGRFGFYGTQLGFESRVDLAGWSLAGREKQVIRTAVNQAKRRGIEIRECALDERTGEISDAWIRTRKCRREIRFLVPPMNTTHLERRRCFYACHQDRAIGFAFFDPIYRDNAVASYVPNVSRASAEFKPGIFYAIMVHAMEVFRKEDVGCVDLGLIPLMLSPCDEAQESPALKRLFRAIHMRGNGLYSFKGLQFTKSRFGGSVEKTYCGHRRALPLMELLAALRLTHLI